MFEAVDERDEGVPLPNDTGYQTRFVGHHQTREELKTAIKGKCRLLQVVGGPVVGKSRLAEQICKELIEESEDTGTKLKFVSILLRNAQSLRLVKMKILQEFSQKSTSFSIVDFQDDIEWILKSQKKTYFMVLFNDCDQMTSTNSLRTAFLEIIYALVTFPRVKVIITSRVQFSLPRINGSFQKTCRLKGLEDEEAMELLSQVAPNVDFTSHYEVILDICCRLPLLLIIVGQKLEEKRHMLSVKELCDFWETSPLEGLSADFGSDEDNIKKIIAKFVASLDNCLQKFLSVFAYFPGTFSADAAAYVAALPKVSHAKVLALIPLNDTSAIEYDKGRYSILPVIRRHANENLTHLRDTDSVRHRFCHFFSKLLTKANADLVRRSTDAVFGQVFEEWVNVEKVLREGALPTADLFRVNMEIIRDAPDIITVMVPESAEPFYRQCLSAAEIFGTEKDIGCIEACIGSAVGYSRGNGLREGIEFLKKAESKLTPEDGYQYVKLMAHFEWNYFRQGNMVEAARYQRKGLEITPSGPEERRTMRQQIAIRNHQALRLIRMGRCKEAITILLDTIEYATQNFEYNPTIRVMLNSLGLAYDGVKQRDKALKYCKASLAERRKYAKWSVRDLVIPLCNLAVMISDNKEFGIAIRLVDEALEIREKIAWEHLDTATALCSKGRVLKKWRKYSEAIEYFENAYRVQEACVKTHHALADIGNEIAFCLTGLGRVQEARDRYQQVINSRHRLQQQEELNALVLQAFGRLLEISDDDDWSRTAADMSQFLESLIAAEETLDSERSVRFRDKLYDIQTQINMRASEQVAGNNNHQEQIDLAPDISVMDQEKAQCDKMAVKQMSTDREDSRTVSLAKRISKLEMNRNNLSHTQNVVKAAPKCIGTTDILTMECKNGTGRDSNERGSDETECKTYHRKLYELSRKSKGESDPRTSSSADHKYDGQYCLRVTATDHECPRRSPEEHDERMGDKTSMIANSAEDLLKEISQENHTGPVFDVDMTGCKSLYETRQFPEDREMLSGTQRASSDNTLLKCCPNMVHSRGLHQTITSGSQSGEDIDLGFASDQIQVMGKETPCSEPNSVYSEHILAVTNIDCPMRTELPQIDLASEIQDGRPLLSEGSTLKGESVVLSDLETLKGDLKT
ncbi:uncharacterized protein LOC135480479 [Liolophura sinensis]|uniref:uncharacterized protein LOC135480479 n=1 Tax=Liolophura sinensis TaxID=3198878 RepID=UPI0031585CCE